MFLLGYYRIVKRIIRRSEDVLDAFEISYTRSYLTYLRIQSQLGKIRTRKTPNTGTFHAALSVYKTFRRRPRGLLNFLCTFNLRPISRGTEADILVNIKW